MRKQSRLTCLVTMFALVLGASLLVGCGSAASGGGDAAVEESTEESVQSAEEEAPAQDAVSEAEAALTAFAVPEFTVAVPDDMAAPEGGVWVVTYEEEQRTSVNGGMELYTADSELDEQGNTLVKHLTVTFDGEELKSYDLDFTYDEEGFGTYIDAHGVSDNTSYSYERDELGNVICETRSLAGDVNDSWWVYNQQGQVVRAINTEPVESLDEALADPQTKERGFTLYDDNGYVVYKQDNGLWSGLHEYDVYAYRYDGDGRPIKARCYHVCKDANGQTVADSTYVYERTFEYDDQGNVTKFVETNGDVVTTRTYEYEWIEEPSAGARYYAHQKGADIYSF